MHTPRTRIRGIDAQPICSAKHCYAHKDLRMNALKSSALMLVALAISPGCSLYPVYAPVDNANNPSITFHTKLRQPLLFALEEIHICSDQKKFRLPLKRNFDAEDNSETTTGETKVTANKRITIQHPFHTTVGVGFQITYSCRTSFTFVPQEGALYHVEAGYETTKGCRVVVIEKLEGKSKLVVPEPGFEAPCKNR